MNIHILFYEAQKLMLKGTKFARQKTAELIYAHDRIAARPTFQLSFMFSCFLGFANGQIIYQTLLHLGLLEGAPHAVVIDGYLAATFGPLWLALKIIHPTFESAIQIKRHEHFWKRQGISESDIEIYIDNYRMVLAALKTQRKHLRGQLNAEQLLEHLSAHEAKSQPQDGVLRFYGATSLFFRQEVEAGWMTIPKAFRDFLGQAEFQLAATEVGTDIAPSLQNKKIWDPQDGDLRTYLNHSFGVYDPAKHIAHVTEFALTPAFTPKTHERPNIYTIADDDWLTLDDRGDTVMHEVGHALNYLVNKFGLLSNTEGFKAAYEEDVAAMMGYYGARERGYTYFVRANDDKGERSRDETFAQLFACLNHPTKRNWKMMKKWPNTTQWMHKFMHTFIEADQTVQRFIFNTRYYPQQALPQPVVA